MQDHPGFFAKIRRRPEHQRRIARTTLFVIIGGGTLFLWMRSFSELAMPRTEPLVVIGTEASPSLLSPFANIRDEFTRAGNAFADLMRPIPAILETTEELVPNTAPATSESVVLGGADAMATTMPEVAAPRNDIAPPPEGMLKEPGAPRIARVEQPSIAAETVLGAADVPNDLPVTALEPSAKTAAALNASAHPSLLDPIRDILLS